MLDGRVRGGQHLRITTRNKFFYHLMMPGLRVSGVLINDDGSGHRASDALNRV